MNRFSRHRSMLIGAALLLLTVATYVPVIWKGGFIWDDDKHITELHLYQDPRALHEIWLNIGATQQYYPLVFTTFYAEQKMWGNAARGYHITNVLLHAMSVILLWRLLLRLNVSGAWLIAAIFAIHPVMVESVAWASERKNVLSLFFSLCAAHFYLRSELPELFTRHRWGAYILAFVCFVLAMYSKTVACTVPPALVVIIWWKRGVIRARDIVAVIPFLIVGIGMGLITAFVERNQIGAEGAAYHFTSVDRILIAGRALWFYATKVIWPHPLIFSYPRWRIDSHAAWQLMFPLAALLILTSLWAMRRKIGRGPVAAVMIFAGLLVPALGFVNVYPMRFSFVADHFQYFAAIALIALFVSIAAKAAQAFRVPVIARVTAAIIVLAGMSILTMRQQHMYRNKGLLWAYTVEQNPGSLIANNNFGAALLLANHPEEAAQFFRAALKIDPNDSTALLNLSKYFSDKGQSVEAIRCLNHLIAAEPRNPDAHHKLGLECQKLGRLDLAISQLQLATYLSPYDAEMTNDLGVAYAKVGRFDDAQRAFERAERFGEYAPTNYNLALIYARQGRAEDTIRELRMALKIQPDYPEARRALDRLLAP